MPTSAGIVHPRTTVEWCRPEGSQVAMMSPPKQFCWTKFGSEAGEDAASILRRKEAERVANNGVFLWGIGSSIRPSLLSLLERTAEPLVVFTPMRSPAAKHDRHPASIVEWVSGVGLTGESYALPPASTVTSGARLGVVPKTHYALVCRRTEPLTEKSCSMWLDEEVLRNLRTGNPVGSSQVTSVVETMNGRPRRARYRVAFTAALVEPFQVALTQFVPARRSVMEGASGSG